RVISTTHGRGYRFVASVVEQGARPGVDGIRRRRSGFPEPSDPFLGRDADLLRLAEAVEHSRVVTLIGPGGVGKTRLEIEFARAHSRDGWFVDLSPVADPDTVSRTILDKLGVSPRTDVADVDRIVEAIAPRRTLLVVDNCEQASDAVAAIVGAI